MCYYILNNQKCLLIYLLFFFLLMINIVITCTLGGSNGHDLQLPVQSVSIITKVVSSNPTQMYM
jgi:hypothetical protein